MNSITKLIAAIFISLLVAGCASQPVATIDSPASDDSSVTEVPSVTSDDKEQDDASSQPVDQALVVQLPESIELPDLPTDTQRDIEDLVAEQPVEIFQDHTIDIRATQFQLPDYPLELAKLFYLRGEQDKARTQLQLLVPAKLTVQQQTELALLSAKVALASGRSQEALEWLNGNSTRLFDSLPLQQQVNISLLRAYAWSMNGDYFAAARERVYLNPLLSAESRLSNQEALWLDLTALNRESLQQLTSLPMPESLAGWVELADLYRRNESNLSALQMSFDQWKQRYPLHEANRQPPGLLAQLSELIAQSPKNIALLLPLSGTYAEAGKAVLNGFLAAYYEQQSELALQIHDVAKADVLVSYRQAVQNGADFVVGPLLREQVNRLALSNLSVPVLALNRVDESLEIEYQNLLFQYALAPEDEVQQIAQLMTQKGMQQAALLLPKSDYGQRISDAFNREWSALGGITSTSMRFSATDNGFQYLATVKGLLGIADSEQRAQNLQSFLGEPVEFEPYRRLDIDWILFAGTPQQARVFKPILNFQYAQNIPVIALSQVYSGTPDKAKDAELEDVNLLTLPWHIENSELKQQLAALRPELTRNQGQLLAMGADSFALIPRLTSPGKQHLSYHGNTGLLELDLLQRIRRQLPMAHYSQGLVVASPQNELR